MDYMELVKNIAGLISTGVLIYVGLAGLRTWRRQLKGNVEYEHARKVLKAVYLVRDEIRGVRNPFMSAGEHIYALEKAGISTKDINLTFDNELRDRAFRLAYQNRLEKLEKAMSTLNLESFEAEVLWGKSFVDSISPLRICVNELFGAVESHFRYESKPPRDVSLAQKVDDIFYGHDQLTTDQVDEIKNEFSKKAIASIKTVEIFIRPHLKL